MVHLIRSEGIELNDMPIPPVDKSKRPKGYVAKKPEEDPDWIEYWYATKSLFIEVICLILYLIVLSADNFCKQFGPRSGLTICQA